MIPGMPAPKQRKCHICGTSLMRRLKDDKGPEEWLCPKAHKHAEIAQAAQDAANAANKALTNRKQSDSGKTKGKKKRGT